VLHICSGDLWAGAEVMVFNLLKELKKNKELRIIALVLNEGTLVSRLKSIEIETHVIPENIHNFPGLIMKAYSLLRYEGIGIIHSHRYKENLIALVLSKLLRIKCIVSTIHGMPETFSHNHMQKKRFEWVARINYFILSKFYQHIIAVSIEIKNRLIKEFHFLGNKVHVIYNGVPEIPMLSNSTSLDGKLTFRIGTVGRLVSVKDFDIVIEIAAIIKNRIKNLQISILGDGPLRAELEKKIKDLNVTEIVELIPHKENPFSYYKGLDIYINTSKHEGIPLSILEAMMCSKPVVAPKVGGIPEIIEDGNSGLLVKSRKAEEFAKACLDLFANSTKRIMIGKNARSRVLSKFFVSQMAESYVNLYKNCGKIEK